MWSNSSKESKRKDGNINCNGTIFFLLVNTNCLKLKLLSLRLVSRRDMVFIRIGTELVSSYIKVNIQFNHHIFPPIIKMCQLSHNS